jgi:serine O-acetyltransferase
MIDELKRDLERYRKAEGSLGRALGSVALWGVTCYRFGHWVYKERSPRLLRPALKAAYLVWNKLLEATAEMYLDPQAEIGEGLYIGHSGGVHINPAARVGRDCDLGHQVTLGTSAGGRGGAPVIGDGVYIGSGAKVIGRVKVGDRARIAANSLVMTNVPAGATVMGVPARVVMLAPAEKSSDGEQPGPGSS